MPHWRLCSPASMRCANNKLFVRSCFAFATLMTAVLTACSAPPKPPSPADQQLSAAARLQRIPAADPARYDNPAEMKAWKNPYLLLRTDGVGLVDRQNNEIRILKTEEVVQTLAQLPPQSWPYGRVVAIQENSVPASDSDATQVRATRGLVAGALDSNHVAIEWIPAK